MTEIARQDFHGLESNVYFSSQKIQKIKFYSNRINANGTPIHQFPCRCRHI